MSVNSATRNSAVSSHSRTPGVVLLLRDMRVFFVKLAHLAKRKRSWALINVIR